jgi:hypothetical protein
MQKSMRNNKYVANRCTKKKKGKREKRKKERKKT